MTDAITWWLANWRTHEDDYTRGKIAVIDKIGQRIPLSEREQYDLAGSSLRTLELFLELLDRRVPGGDAS
jgi:hypothetical protein